jgi:hypothetical protein
MQVPRSASQSASEAHTDVLSQPVPFRSHTWSTLPTHWTEAGSHPVTTLSPTV